MDEQIVPNRPHVEIVEIPQISEYINLAFQLIPIADKALDLAKQLDEEKTNRLVIRENADIQRKTIERRMDQLDAELEADLENNKNFISASMRAFEKMVEAGHIEQAMILHERVISRLSGRVSVAADKFNQNNPNGQVKFYTT
ncbi:MAG: hypothetical protein ACFE0I_22590 [Elainellaceae cyanobacterium]